RVKEILQMNEQGEVPETLQVDKDFSKMEQAQAMTNDLERLDRKYKNKSKKKPKNRNSKNQHPNKPNNNSQKGNNQHANRKFGSRKNKKQ
ncbi:MAG: hypothetical protein L3J06_10040, partial [Cyclobacteriaceae bacterium]|nr:hypothetical protein [Cyclobacteriaceae bacterium]